MNGRDPIPAHYNYERAQTILGQLGLSEIEIEQFWKGYSISLYYVMQHAADRHIEAFGKDIQKQRSEKQHENRRLG